MSETAPKPNGCPSYLREIGVEFNGLRRIGNCVAKRLGLDVGLSLLVSHATTWIGGVRLT